MSVRSGDIIIAGISKVDNSSITRNSNRELQAIGIIDQKTNNADKIWSGSLSDYNDIITKDPNTLYYVTGVGIYKGTTLIASKNVAGTGITITNNTDISVDTSVIATQSDLSTGLATKQDVLTAGSNIQINNNTISATDTTYTAGTGLNLTNNEFSVDTNTIQTKITSENKLSSDLVTDINQSNKFVTTEEKAIWNAKQNALTAGNNIQIDSSTNTISATDTTYTAGTGLSLSGTSFNVNTSVIQEKLLAGSNIQINGTTISATDTTYTAGTGISIIDNVISNTQTSAEWGNITGTLSDQTDLQTALDAKQGILTAGSNIQINGSIISATDTTYTAGTGISIVDNVISNTQTSAIWGNITGTLSNQTDLQTALNAKENTLTLITNAEIDTMFA